MINIIEKFKEFIECTKKQLSEIKDKILKKKCLTDAKEKSDKANKNY